MKSSQILQHLGMSQGTASKRDIRKAWYLADDGGVIQAVDAMELFHDPRLHQTMGLDDALRHLGCVDDI